jgi:2-aminoadipate transaminase
MERPAGKADSSEQRDSLSLDAEESLSAYGRSSREPSPVSRMMAAFSRDFRDDIDINLGVGYVNESTIPRDLIEEALHAVLADPRKYRYALNYGDPAGSLNLIESIRQFYLRHGIGGLNEELLRSRRIIIGGNGATSLLEALAQVTRPGIVVTADPNYYIYCNFLERLGYEILAVPENENGIDADRLETQIRRLAARKDDVRFFYLVTVNNPTCSILANSRRRRVVEIAADLSRELGRKVPVVFDQSYENLIHDPSVDKPLSGLLHDDLGLVCEIGTLSKILAPALRIGYMIASDGPLLRAVVQKTSDSGFSAPLIAQEMAGYLLDRHIETQIVKVNAGYRTKAIAVRRWIDSLLGPFLEDCRGGRAGFYYYLTFKRVETRENSPFFKFLSRTAQREDIDGPGGAKNPRVAYIPGEFCVHQKGELVEAGNRQLRLSYGFEELPRIERAIALMRQAAEYSTAVAAMI